MLTTIIDHAPTLVTVLAGGGVTTLLGKLVGARSERTKIEAEAITRISGAYGKALADVEARCATVEADLADSTADRRALHGELETLRARVRQDERERSAMAKRWADLLEHVRVLRTILSANRIEYPAGPAFLDDGGASA